MRSKNEIYKEVINLNIETKELKDFMEALKNEDILHPKRKFTSVFVEKKNQPLFRKSFFKRKEDLIPYSCNHENRDICSLPKMAQRIREEIRISKKRIPV